MPGKLVDYFTLAEFVSAGFTCSDLKNAGCTAAELKAAGYQLADMIDARYSLAELKAGGYLLSEMQAAGFALWEFLGAVSNDDQYFNHSTAFVFSFAELKSAGFTLDEMKASFSIEAKRNADGYANAHKIAARCTLAELKAGGYLLSEMQAAGFTLREFFGRDIYGRQLTPPVFSFAELKSAGFTCAEMKAAGCSLAELKAGGYLLSEMQAAGFTLLEFFGRDIHSRGSHSTPPVFSFAELKSAGYTCAEMKAAHCSVNELKECGYLLADMKTAGFTATELRYGHHHSQGYRTVPGVVTPDLFSAAELKAAGFTCQELGSRAAYRRFNVDGGFTLSELVAAGFPEVEALNADRAAVERAAALVTTGAELKKYARAKLHARTDHLAVLKRFWVSSRSGCALLHWNSFHESPLRITHAQLGPSQLLQSSGIQFDSSNCFSVYFQINSNPSQGQGCAVTDQNCVLDLVASSRSEAESWVRGIQAVVGLL